ncbi:hypothetical protein EYR41_006624 [Orbilia oligospora]|uniref:Uncharacterized protein n=1 Tax=Orbilia oligospora TaxID=2813651 RepID=A0A8H2DV51_ORBOL|nr:hypothetical protein TWF132_000795 [Orbilia oligospora]TGJ67495.1 hypothetical protein EYR41_006624 [Orbilia oligospora]
MLLTRFSFLVTEAFTIQQSTKSGCLLFSQIIFETAVLRTSSWPVSNWAVMVDSVALLLRSSICRVFIPCLEGPRSLPGSLPAPPSRGLSENTSEITISEDAYDRYSRSHPPGFINLIINTNPGLSPRCLQAIADKKADRCNYNIFWRIQNIIELCSGELEGMLKTTVAGYAKKLIGEIMVEKKGVLKEGFDEEVNFKVTGLVAEEFEKVMIGIFAEKCKEIVRGGLLQSSD